MRQRIRRAIVLVSLLCFPVTMNYLSPYVSIAGAASGLFVASLAMFAAMFVGSLVLGRLWCGWVCPVAGLSDACTAIQPKPVNLKVLRAVRYVVWALWLGTLGALLAAAGGFHGVQLLFFTESGVSVDEPIKYFMYFLVLALLLALTLTLGRRGACHAVCWMSPFMELGGAAGRALRLPQLHIAAEEPRCNGCNQCTRHCPMSIDVKALVPTGGVRSTACILCGECVDGCKQKALRYGWLGQSATKANTQGGDLSA